MSTRETLIAALATALTGVAGGRVYRLRQEQIGTLPAVVIRPLSEEAAEGPLSLADRRITIGFDVYAKGDTPDTAADATLAAVWAALAAAPDLGLGSEVQLEMSHGIDWDDDAIDHIRATLRATYSYRTALGSM